MKADAGRGGDGAFLKVLTPEFLSRHEGGLCGVGRREGVRECWLAGWLAGLWPLLTRRRGFSLGLICKA